MCASFIITLTSPNPPKRYECLLRWSWRSLHPILRLRVHWALRWCGSFQGTRYIQTSQGGFRNGMWLKDIEKSLNGMYIECILNVYWMYQMYIEFILNVYYIIYIYWIYLGQKKRLLTPKSYIRSTPKITMCFVFTCVSFGIKFGDLVEWFYLEFGQET